MPPIVYLAIGGRSTLADLQVALAVGQRHFLVPAGTAMADTLRTIPADVRVVLDSGAWPIDNPDRLRLPAYAAAVMRWQQPDGSWGRLDWCAAYDHITDPAATQRDYRRLVGIFHASGVENTPVVPVTHYPDGPSSMVNRGVANIGLSTASTLPRSSSVVLLSPLGITAVPRCP